MGARCGIRAAGPLPRMDGKRHERHGPRHACSVVRTAYAWTANTNGAAAHVLGLAGMVAIFNPGVPVTTQ